MSDNATSLSDLRLTRTLLNQPGWLEELPPQVRKGILARVLQIMQKSDARSREVIGAAKVMIAMEKNDLERCKQLVQLEFKDDGDSDVEADRNRGRGDPPGLHLAP